MKQRRNIRVTRVAKTVGLFTLGAAIGSMAALLCAPASGRVTRRRINLRLRTLKRETTRQIGQSIKQAQTWVLQRVSNGNGRRVHHPTLHHA